MEILWYYMNYFNSKYDFEFWKTLHMPDVYKLNFDKIVSFLRKNRENRSSVKYFVKSLSKKEEREVIVEV